MRTRKSAGGIIRQTRKHVNKSDPVCFNIEKLGPEQINLATLEINEACVKINELLTQLEADQSHKGAIQPEDALCALVNQSANFPFSHQLAIIEIASRHPFIKHLPHVAAGSLQLAFGVPPIFSTPALDDLTITQKKGFKRY